ncbi:hypothetical protein K458DRAFT_338040 [Lentithecium fluviatile CBS 122367]|uniref:N-acetyltransferase domain-containing protein n=1 Tax=Lentithecium fluviatile CBS 122367 TaxID=1168545 RepID=A0A6G1J2X4_9PLEO|nr:hypothetical protein K458DRAFT_338040 [Lentithecium fluviatile CBS 122367]
MPLELHPCVESDFPDMTRIQTLAFNSGIASFLFPQRITPEWTSKNVAKNLKCFRTEPDVHFLKVIDTEQNGKVIAWSKWRINEKQRSDEEIQTMLPVPGKEEEERPAAQEFMRYLHRVRKQYMGTRPYSFLQVLVVDPEEQRRGAGAMLIQWGLERADKAQLPCFLEASEAGRPLYARWGFEAVAEEVFDLAKYGGEGRDVNTVMIRPPKQSEI